MLGTKFETNTEETGRIPVEKGGGQNNNEGLLTPAYSKTGREARVTPPIETAEQNTSKLFEKAAFLEAYVANNKQIDPNTRKQISNDLANFKRNLKGRWMSEALSYELTNISKKNPAITNIANDFNKFEDLAKHLEQKSINKDDIETLADKAGEFIQKFPKYQNEEKDTAVNKKQKTLFEAFKKVTGVKSEDDKSSNLDEKGQQKALQNESLKYLTMFERIMLSININFLHKDDPKWLKDYLFNKVRIPVSAKSNIIKFFYPDVEPNSLKKVGKPEEKNTKNEEKSINKSKDIDVESSKKTKSEGINKIDTFDHLIDKKTSKEKLDIIGKESLLGNVSETGSKITEFLIENLQNHDTTTKLNGTINQVNKLIYDYGIIPSKESIAEAFSKIRNSSKFESKDEQQTDIVEKSVNNMIRIRTAENNLINKWEQEAIQSSTSKDDKENVNDEMVQEIIAQKLIDHIIDYRSNLAEGQKGRIANPQEAEQLKLDFAQSIKQKKIKAESKTNGQTRIPILLFDDFKEQAKLYGSKNPTDRNKVSPGRFFFDGKLIENSNGEEVPSLLSTISFVTSDYKEHPELLEHELIHATHELQQHTRREVFRESFQKRTLKSALIGESLIKFILSGDTKTQINTLRAKGVDIPEETISLVGEIKNETSDNEIQYYISGGYKKDENGKGIRTEATTENKEKIKAIHGIIKNSADIGIKDSSEQLILNYIEKGSSGVSEFDSFIKHNHQINNSVTKIGEHYNRFYNPINEAVTNYVSSERSISLGDLKISNFDKNNPELIGGLALVRLLNEHNKTKIDMLSNEKMELFNKEKIRLANYLNSSPLYNNGRVTIGSTMEILSNSLENPKDPIHKLLNIIVPNIKGEINQEYIGKLKETIPVLKRWIGDNPITDTQYRLLLLLFPDELLNNFDAELKKESIINEEDYGIGKAINNDALMRKAVTNVYQASQYGTTPPNKRTGMSYGGKMDIFSRPFHPKDPGSPLLQGWGWNSKTFTDMGFGASKQFKLNSTDPLEALSFAIGIPLHRLPFFENLREKIWSKSAYTPDTYVSPSPKAYTDGVFKQIFGVIREYGGLEEMAAITLMTKIGGFNFSLQGQPSYSNDTWIATDEYRNNEALAKFIEEEVRTVNPDVVNKLGKDSIQVGGHEIEVESFKVGQMSKGYLNDILEAMVMGEYTDSSKKPFNKYGHDRMEYDKSLKKVENNTGKRAAFERIANIMMAADKAKRDAGGTAYTLKDMLLDSVNRAQLTLPKELYKRNKDTGKIEIDKDMQKIYEQQTFTINVNDNIIGEGMYGEGDKGEIGLQDAKDFFEYAIIARAEKVMSVGVWGKEVQTDESSEKLLIPEGEDIKEFIENNNFEISEGDILKRGPDSFKVGRDIAGQRFIIKITEGRYSKTAKIKTGAVVYGHEQNLPHPIENFTSNQLDFFFGKKDKYKIIDKNGNEQTIIAREKYDLNKGLMYDSIFDHLDKINQGKKLSFLYSMKLLETDRYREYSQAQKELWEGIRNIDNFYRFAIMAATAVGVLVPGMAILANPGLFVGLMAWSVIASPLIDRQFNGWNARMLASIEAGGDIMAYSERFNNLANEDHPPSFGDLDLARSQMETIKYKWRTVLVSMSKNAKWDTNIFTNIFNQLWGKAT